MKRFKIFLYLLAPFSIAYFLLTHIRNIFYDIGIFRSYRVNAKVISVGNITWGGTGKTPSVSFISGLLSKKNHRVSILIRGYGKDESKLFLKIAANIPVLVGKDRVSKARVAIEKHLADTVILDDGFQYRRIARDLDIVCIDATDPFGNGWLIPAGSMREGIGSLRRADVFLITKTDLCAKDKLERLENRLAHMNLKAIIVKAIHRPLYFYKLSNEEKVTISQLNNKEIVLLSAIGSPASFEKTILRLGLKINRHFIFRDHYAYTKDDIARIEEYCKKNRLETIVTTEKDAVKLSAFSHQLSAVSSSRGGLNLPYYLVLKVGLEITENEQGFYNRLFGIYNS